VITLLCALPVTAEESVDTELNNLLNKSSLLAGESDRRRQLLKNWSDFVSQQLKKAENLLEDSRTKQSSFRAHIDN